jgi:hypothetical protein
MAKLVKPYRIQRGVASLIGAGLVGLSGWYSWMHFHDVSAPIAAVVGAGMFHFGEVALKSRRWLTATLFGALGLLAVVISLTAVIARTSSAYDERIQSRQSENLSRIQAQKAVDEAKEVAAQAEAQAAAECSSGRKLKCKGLEERATEARQRVDQARTQLVQLGAHTAEDPGARRIAAMIPGLSEAQYGLLQPLLLPMWLELSGLSLLTYGLSKPKVQAKAPKAKRKRKKRKALGTPSGPKTARVVARPALKLVVNE